MQIDEMHVEREALSAARTVMESANMCKYVLNCWWRACLII